MLSNYLFSILLLVISFILQFVNVERAYANVQNSGIQNLEFLSSDFDYTRLLSVEAKCSRDVERLHSLVQKYHQASRKNRSIDYAAVQKSIQSLLQANDLCKVSLQRAFILSSVELLEIDLDKKALRLLVSQLLNNNVIQALDIDKRREMGGKYLAQNSKSEFTALGAYECEKSKILVDTSLAPYDLAVTVVHELNHLFIDKTLQVDWLQSKLNASIEQIVLLEEMLSVLQTGYYQKTITSLTQLNNAVLDSKRISRFYSGEFSLPSQSEFEVVQLKKRETLSYARPHQNNTTDFNLFLRNGPLAKIWNRFYTNSLFVPQTKSTYYRALPKSPWNFVVGTLFSVIDDETKQFFVDQLAAITKGGYFSKDIESIHNSLRNLDINEKRNAAIQLSSLSLWLAQNEVVTRVVFDETTDNEMFEKKTEGLVYSQDLRGITRAIEKIVKTTKSKSAYCEHFTHAHDAGELTNYGRHEDRGVKGEDRGVKF